ncbi:MAG: N-acetylmuramoyl-L-alanine amidase [Brumimicrobium sp.]
MRLIPFLISLFIAVLTFSQQSNISNNTDLQYQNRIKELGMPFSTVNVPQELLPGNTYTFELNPDHLFSCFGVGFESTNNSLEPNLFQLNYRTKPKDGSWSEWMESEADVHPNQTPTKKYWTEALFTHDASSQSFVQLRITVPIAVNGVQIDLFDGNYEDGDKISDDTKNNKVVSTSRANCPEFPSIIERSEWCGGVAACSQVNAGYTPTYINVGHIVIHHGASPNTYTDGQAVVRSYYNYHVNTLGWTDIGYNYLIDKYGNFYQGRHNPNLPTSDVRGAHAGAANSSSIGVNFLGNLDVTIATTAQLNKLYDVLAWWFDYKALDPLGSANMQTQAYGVQYMERITCHRDINPTSCPGNDMYARMSNIRQEVQDVIDDCNNVVTDNIAPTTEVNSVYDWRGYDFWTDFDDVDNPGGSGVDQQYYQVLDFDGTEWRANSDNGFFNDNFNTTIHPGWTIEDGTWSIQNNVLNQNDETLGNTNIYADLVQNNNNSYLYQWSASVDGTGANRRSGLHFFVDDPTLPNRGNSYLAWFRADDNAVSLYKVENDVLNLLVSEPFTINADTWYDFKVTFDPVTGEFEAFIDNESVASYTDPSPHTSGSYISLRNGDSEADFENLKVRINRNFQEKVTVGPQSTKDSRYESPNKTQDACRVNSIVKDAAGNWSSQQAKHFYIDWTDPTTSSSVANSWQTDDFTTTFSDSDNVDGSGLQKSFYQVIDFDGSYWGANAENGFYSDNFDQGAIHPNWTEVSGNWNISNNYLEQTDENNGNTNLYAYLKQDLSNRYLYNFSMKLDGSGNNKRGGFHYFCDDPTASNRGNSYFVWFRQELQTLEFYSVSNDTFTQEKVIPIEFDQNVWMDVKVIYDRVTGETFVYKDDNLIGEWVDNMPLLTGDYVSFRSGNSNMSIDNFKVYRTRYPSVQVSVGSPTSDIRYQNLDPSTFSAKVKSIVQDTAQNLSQIHYLDLDVDWTPPVGLTSVLDGSNVDIDTFYTNTEITGSWNAASDNHSDVSYYEMSVGTAAGDSNIVSWTDVGNVTENTFTGLSLAGGTTYFINTRAVNGAGLSSSVVSSDGQYLNAYLGLENTDDLPFSVYPNPFDNNIQIEFLEPLNDVELKLYSLNGQVVELQKVEQSNSTSYNLHVEKDIAKGMYILEIHLKDESWKTKLIKK